MDNKTAKNPYAQDTVDEDLQLTSYAYLLAANRYVFPTADVYCRFDVFRKLKTPKFEQHYTIRAAKQRRRFARVTAAVLSGIEARIFMPSKGWMCGDCQFADACREWWYREPRWCEAAGACFQVGPPWHRHGERHQGLDEFSSRYRWDDAHDE